MIRRSGSEIISPTTNRRNNKNNNNKFNIAVTSNGINVYDLAKQTKYEKLYNKALRKMRNLNGNKEYKSDSCLPSSNVSS